jgi:hypothetical protein
MDYLAVEGLSTGPVTPDVSITVTPIVPGPGCATAYSDDLEETPCSKNKADGKFILTGAKVGRKCPALDAGTVTEVIHIKATFVATSTKCKVEGNAPLKKNDTAPGGICACTLTASPFTPFNMTFIGSIDNAGQDKVKGN